MKRLALLVLLFLAAFPNLASAFYDPAAGRWISRDPIAERGGMNLYGFVENNAIRHWDYLGKIGEDLLKKEGLAGAAEAARQSIRFDEIYNSDNWTIRLWGKDGEIPFKLEYAGLVCKKCNADGVDEYKHTSPHPGVISGPNPREFKGKELLIRVQVANYDPADGHMMVPAGATAYSDPTYNYATKKDVSCEIVFGKGWKKVGVYHSHPRKSGLNPSGTDKGNYSDLRRFLGTVNDQYQITTSEY